MIEMITLENFLSFKDKVEFNFSASQEKSKKGFEYMRWFEEVNGKKILKTQFFFGNNGTGKTNFMKAVSILRDLVCNNSKSKSDDAHKIPDCAFKLSEETKNQPSRIKIVFHVKEICYSYEIKWINNVIIFERLEKKRGKNKYSCLFTRTFDYERDVTQVLFPSKAIKQEIQNIIIENTIKNSSVISIYDSMNIESQDLKNVYSYFVSIGIILNLDDYELSNLLNNRKDDDKLKTLLLFLLDDLGSNIVDYQMDTIETRVEEEEAKFWRNFFGEESYIKMFPNGCRKVKSIRFGHPTDVKGQIGWLRENEESFGTVNMIKLIIVLYDSCKYQAPFFIDECSYGIHQMTFGRIIQFFLALSQKSQAIMASQNLAIMEMEGFRRDTIKIFDKNRDTGVTFCGKIDLRKYHKNLNIVKTYLNNSFGSLPKFPPLNDWIMHLKNYRNILEEE